VRVRQPEGDKLDFEGAEPSIKQKHQPTEKADAQAVRVRGL